MPSKSWKKQAFWHGHAARTSTKKLRSEKLRGPDFSFPKNNVQSELGITAFQGRRFLQKTAGNRRFSQKTAGNRRFSQKPLCPIEFVPFRASAPYPENAKGGGKKEGGAKPHEETPHGKRFPTPLTSVRFAPPFPISLSKPLRNSQNFPQLTSSETIFGGSRKAVSDGPSSRGFAFRYVLPPPLALPSISSFSQNMERSPLGCW